MSKRQPQRSRLLEDGLCHRKHYGVGELSQLEELCLAEAERIGRTPPETVFHLAPSEAIYDIAARGLPGRYSHWRFGQDYERMKSDYDKGRSRIYELVLNTRPVHAYLLDGNSLVAQLLVIAHVHGHANVYANNHYFRPVDNRFLVRARAAAERVERYCSRYGRTEVEDLIDAAEACSWSRNFEQLGGRFQDDDPEYEDLPYAELFPEETVELRERFKQEQEAARQRFPRHPVRDLLGFIAEHSRLLDDWQRDVISIVRDETHYSTPSARTKLVNEGFAVWWHNKVLQALQLETEDFIEYQKMNARVTQPHPAHPNVYSLGWEMLKEVERIATAPTANDRERWPWAGQVDPVERVFEVVDSYDDLAFVSEFITPRVCERAKLFAWEHVNTPKQRGIRITSREADEVRARLVKLETNLGLPVIEIVDADGLGQGQLWLEHRHDDLGLDREYAQGTLRHVARLWGKPVVCRTIKDGGETLWFVARPGEDTVEAFAKEPSAETQVAAPAKLAQQPTLSGRPPWMRRAYRRP